MIRNAAVILLALSAICGAQSTPPSTSPQPKTAEQVFKNIQVLKGVPADQLIPAMQFITASLGVQCDFCHLENAFEKDDKEAKQTARKMMRMLSAINKENFDGHTEVSCYACHRGAQKPVVIPVIGEESVPPANTEKAGHNEASATGLPSADQIIEKYLQVMGGAQTAAGSSPRLQKGTLIVGTAKFPVEVLTKGPDNRVTTVHFPSGENVTAFNPQMGWLSSPGHGVHNMSTAEADAARLDAYPQFAVDFRRVFKELRVQQVDKIDDHSTYEVDGLRDGLPPVKLYFDQDSGQLVRLLRYIETPLGLNPAEIDFYDYREDAGRKEPFRWTIARPGGRFTIQIDQVERNLRISDEKFAPPPA